MFHKIDILVLAMFKMILTLWTLLYFESRARVLWRESFSTPPVDAQKIGNEQNGQFCLLLILKSCVLVLVQYARMADFTLLGETSIL